jgi:nucleotide-binding universal stress UspA family protein
MDELKSVLLAYDFSEASRKPLQHALAIARHYRAKLFVAYVVSSIGYKIAGPEASLLASEASLRDARDLEMDLVKRGALSGLQYEFLVREGDIVQRLEQIIREKHVDAVVVGTHGRGALGRLILGSVAERIFRCADCQVLTVGPDSPEDSLLDKNETGRTFLLATDFEPGSLRSLSYATSFACHFRANLVVLQILPAAPLPEGFHWSTTGDFMEMRKQAETASQKRFQEFMLPNIPAEVSAEFLVKFGIASEQILEACHALKADLLILGLNRVEHIQTASHWPGGTAYKLVSTANCPVLTLKRFNSSP